MPAQGFVTSDIEDIYFELWGGQGDTVVLGHGMGGSHAVWYQQVAELASRYRVVTWDQRGFGRSTRNSGEIGPKPAVGDLETLLDHLEIERAHIVGQSMGGWSALGFAVEHPARTASLILADSTAGVFTPDIRDGLEAYGAQLAGGPPPEQWALGEHPAIGAQLTENDLAQAFLYTQLGSLTNPPGPGEIIPLLMSTDHTSQLSELEVPTLFVVGEHDPIFPPTMISGASELIAGSEVAIVPDTGHSPYFESPNHWNKLVDDFMRTKRKESDS